MLGKYNWLNWFVLAHNSCVTAHLRELYRAVLVLNSEQRMARVWKQVVHNICVISSVTLCAIM